MSPTFQSTRLQKTRLQTECAYCWGSRHSLDAAPHCLVSIHTTCTASILYPQISKFQSTRSNASKGTIDVEIEQKYCVSIHAVYGGTTHSRIFGAILVRPRIPRGTRRLAAVSRTRMHVSTRVPRGTSNGAAHWVCNREFQSTCPARGTTMSATALTAGCQF